MSATRSATSGVIVLWSILLTGAAPSNWEQLDAGLELYRGSFKHRNLPGRVDVTAIRASKETWTLKIVEAGRPEDISASNQAYVAPSLRSLFAVSKHPVAVMNGSYVTSYAFPKPLGLLRVRGQLRVPANSGSPFSGYLCVGHDRWPTIVKAKEEPSGCTYYSLQSGPLVVEAGGKQGISSKESAERRFARSIVCIDAKNRLLLIRSEPTALYDISLFLLTPSDAGGPNCVIAINMSGDADAGLFWRHGGSVQGVGSQDSPLATALVLVRR